ncbi:MAG TPA: metalloregulator ArsR/SmtB family transcription factor [Gemmatimonadales bacterium]|nr:metalloregulator ArsR/SmtB family transcription factor [Gemmatimonadales bacterium]
MPNIGPRRFRNTVYQQLARIGKALASPRRLELLDLLAQGPYTVERLARLTGQSVANASQHLQVLRRARLVESEKHGLYVTYRLPDEGVAQFYRALRILAETRLAEIQRVAEDFLAARGLLEPVDREDLVRRVLRGEVTLLDVRPAEEYRAGHIPHAVSLPLGQLEQRLAELPRDRDIVAYCRGPYCVLAVEAVSRLRARGFRALRLEDGVPDWRARGLPVAAGSEPAGAAA